MIRNIGSAPISITQHSPTANTGKKVSGDFKAMFDEVNAQQIKADNMISELVAGTNKDIPSTMVAMEKAETSMKMLMALRNKMVTAYQETMRMQF